MQHSSSLRQPSIRPRRRRALRYRLHPAIVIGRLIRHESVQTTSVLIRSSPPRAISVIEWARLPIDAGPQSPPPLPLSPYSLIYISHPRPTTFTLEPVRQRTPSVRIASNLDCDGWATDGNRSTRVFAEIASSLTSSQSLSRSVVCIIARSRASTFMCRGSRVILLSLRHRGVRRGDATRRAAFLSCYRRLCHTRAISHPK